MLLIVPGGSEMSLLTCFYTFMTALFAALIMVPFLRKWAFDQGNLDIPDERKMHKTPMPRLGGIAIFLSFLFSVLIYVQVTPVVQGLLAGGLIIFVTGLIDDLTGLTARRKLVGEIAACLAAIVLGKLWLVDLGNLFGLGNIIMPTWIGIPFTIFAVVGVINAINLIDGLDGLAGGLSVMALAAFFMISWIADDHQTLLLAAALAGGVLGFLKYNFYPARIFMGDTGSLTVGFILGFLAVHVTQQPHAAVSPMVPVLILGLPLLDTVWVMSQRALNGISPFSADRTHLHHKFLDLGFEHRFTVIMIYSMMFFWISIALMFSKAPEYWLLLFMLISSALFYFGLRYILSHPQKFIFLNRDSVTAIRSSVTYQRISDLIDELVPWLLPVLVGYLALALWTIKTHNVLSWEMTMVLLAAGIYLWYRPFTNDRHYLMLVLYVVVGMASVLVWHGEIVLTGSIDIKRCGDILLAVAGIVVILKLQFRRSDEFLLSTVDYLVLAVCIFLAIAAQQNTLDFNLNGALLRTIVAILIVRTLCSRSYVYLRLVTGLSLVFLVFVVLIKFIA